MREMKAGKFATTTGTALVLVMSSAALAWADCMLAAASAVMALRVFLLRMDHGAPWRPLAASVNCLTAGVLSIAAGAVLVAGVGAAWLGWWQPAAPHPALAIGLLVVGSAWCCLSRTDSAGAIHELLLWALVLAGVVVAMRAWSSGLLVAPCLFVAAVGVVLVRAGWNLSARTARDLMYASAP